MKKSTHQRVTFWLIWLVLFSGCGLLSFAIAEYKRAEADRMQRVHTQGMVVGSTLCGRSL